MNPNVKAIRQFGRQKGGGIMSALISNCGNYRYELRREISDLKNKCLFIMLNPSTADAAKDDNTIRRCMGFARTWGFGELIVINLFAFRATKPIMLKKVADPIGEHNEFFILQVLREVNRPIKASAWHGANSGIVVCAWGNPGVYKDQDEAIMSLLESAKVNPYCLGINSDGTPKHPLRLRKDTGLVNYTGRRHIKSLGAKP